MTPTAYFFGLAVFLTMVYENSVFRQSGFRKFSVRPVVVFSLSLSPVTPSGIWRSCLVARTVDVI
jgi:hypothetical protein